MSRLRSIAAATVLMCIAVPAVASAQNGNGGATRGGGGNGARRMAALFEGITLTTTEQSQVDSIRAAYHAKMGDVKMGPDMSDADRQKVRDSMRQEVDDLRSVLAPDQQKQFDANVAAFRSSGRQGGGAPPSPNS
jgi:Spy/CpxP family protein refolding chaperone